MLGLIFLGLASVWQFGLSARWTQRIQAGRAWESTFVGAGTFPDPATGTFPAKDTTSTSKRLAIVSVDQAAGAVILEDRFLVRYSLTSQTTWE